MKIISYLIGLIFLIIPFFLFGQNIQLADQYYNDGEYDKAAIIYKELYDKSGGQDYYLSKLIECYKADNNFQNAHAVITQAINKNRQQPILYILEAKLYKEEGKDVNYKESIAKILPNLPKDKNLITRAVYELDAIGESKLAVDIASRAEEMIGNGSMSLDLFYFNLRSGNIDKALNYAISALQNDPQIYDNITSNIARIFIGNEEYDQFQSKIYEKLATNPDNVPLIKLLAWTFIQKKDYKNAMRQMKALLTRDDTDQINVRAMYQLGVTTMNEGAYEIALEAFKQVMDQGRANALFNNSANYYFDILVKSKVKLAQISSADQQQIDTSFHRFLEAVDFSPEFGSVILTYADYLVKYKNNLKKAIDLLNNSLSKTFTIKAPVGSRLIDPRYTNARMKIALADYMLMTGERWDASLLYSQVDKDFKEEVIGQEARYKNALLSYYVGDFEWAQAQFDVLKTATSRVIANDAIDRSVFIMDNMGLDTTDVAMKMFAQSELLIYRNQFAAASSKLDSMRILFPEHSLDDDILWLEGQIYLKKNQFADAIQIFDKIIQNYPEDIRADNAIYETAIIYDRILNSPEKAMPFYEKLFSDYPGSLLAQDARVRYRELRGDKIQ